MNRTTKIIVWLIIMAQVPVTALATRFINSKEHGFKADPIYDDDVFIAGNKIKWDSRVKGDLFTFSAEVAKFNTVEGSFNAFGNVIKVLGPVEGSFRGFGNQVDCLAPVGRNLLIAGNEVTIGPEARITKNADITCADVSFDGSVDGNLRIFAGKASIAGEVGGDLIFEGKTLYLDSDAVIKGDLIYRSTRKAEISNPKSVKGETKWTIKEIEEKDSNIAFAMFKFIVSYKGYLLLVIFFSSIIIIFSLIPFPTPLVVIGLWIMMFISGGITLALTKKKSSETEEVLSKRLLPSIGLGFIILLLAPLAIFVLMITVIAAPLGAALMFLFGAASFAGLIYALLFAGRMIFRLFGLKPGNGQGYFCFLVGMVIAVLLSIIPVAGYLITLLLLMAGLGGLTLTFFDFNLGEKK